MSDTSSALRAVPGSPRLLLHADAGRAGRRVSSLTGASDWRRALVDRVGAGAVGLLGTRWLRPAERWAWPDCSADELTVALHNALPGLRVLGAAVPRQAGRRRLSLLARSSGTLTVIKLGADAVDGSLPAEAAALELLRANPLPGIATPHVLASGVLRDLPAGSTAAGETIEFVATTSVAIGSQRAAIDIPLRTFAADLAVRLAALPKDPSTPVDAVPIHGDLTPWNLRRTRRGLALFDWESAGWGRAGSDIDTYRTACDEIRPIWRTKPAGLR